MQGLQSGDLSIELVEAPGEVPGEGAPLVCTWKGKSNDRHPTKLLAPFFDELLATTAASGQAIEMHFEGLDHFNSSTITALIKLIQAARAKGVRVTFVYDQELKWQRLSFDALRVFEKGDGLFELRSA